jgi:integrase
MKTPSFPLTITEKGVSAVIRKYERIRGGKTHSYFIIDYILKGKRKQECRTDLNKAKAAAQAACIKIANGQQPTLELTSLEQLSYIRAVELLAPVRVPVDTACREYADAQQILGGKASITEACREWIKRNAVELQKITVADAAKKLGLETLREKSLLRRKALAWSMAHLEKAFGSNNVDFITPDLISRHLSGLDLAERSKKNHRDSIGFFNRWLILRGYLAKGTDWLENVQDYSKAKTGEIEIYTPEEIKKILLGAGDMTPFVAIGAFAGLRHAETARLDWREIDLEDGFIEVHAAKSKTGERRLVPIHDNLKQWLLQHRPASGDGPVTPYANTTKQLSKVARAAGMEWKHNALRHSFISYRVAESADVPRVSDEAGNSPQMIRQHYLRRVKPLQATEWFSIMPNINN